jgi:hypothetical protein
VSKNADVPRKPLALVAQSPELSQLDLAQGRPAPKEKRHTLIATTSRVSKLVLVEQRKVSWKVLDQLAQDVSPTPCAGAVWHLGRTLTE